MVITNKLGLPEGLVEANRIERSVRTDVLRATSLIAGLKSKILKDRHDTEIEVDVSDLFWASFGTAFHKLCESEGAHDFSEVDIAFEMDGMKIRGRIDSYNMQTGTVVDYKTTGVFKWKYKNFEDYKKQGFIYAWLLRKNGFEVKECKFFLCFKDYSKAEAKRCNWYPSSQIEVVTFKFTEKDFEDTEVFVKEKIEQYKAIRNLPDDEVPICSEVERWHKEDKYAVYTKAKTGKNKGEWKQKADTVENTNDEAVAWAGEKGLKDDEYEIRKRAGEDTKCLEYCDCKEFCNHYKSLVASLETEEANNE